MTDYAALIDGPTWAFIRASEAAYPPDAATLTIAAQRAIYDTMCCAFFQGFSARDHRKGCARVRCALPDLSGPGQSSSLDSRDDVCAEIQALTGTVVSVGYRLSPEHLHPAALQDTQAVACHLAAQGSILLVGDSAGANLAAAAAHALRGEAGLRILGQVLIPLVRRRARLNPASSMATCALAAPCPAPPTAFPASPMPSLPSPKANGPMGTPREPTCKPHSLA